MGCSIWSNVESFYLQLEEPFMKRLWDLEEGEPNVTFYRKFKFEDLQ
jgi:hypothetical protein